MGTRTGTYYTGTIDAATNGTLVTLIDAICVTGEGWTKTFTGTERGIWRTAAGNQFSFRILDNGSAAASRREALVRGCESATTVDTVVDPFPTVAQLSDANCMWRKSNTTDATARTYHAWCDDRTLILYIAYNGPGFQSDTYIFGDLERLYPGDNYCTAITVRRTGNDTTQGLALSPILNTIGASFNDGAYYVRTEDGLQKSTKAAFLVTGTSIGNTGGIGPGTYPAPRTLDLALLPVMLVSSGATSGNAPNSSATYRGIVPGIFQPYLANNSAITGLAGFDTFTDTAYDPSSEFIMLAGQVTFFGGGNIVMQTAGTWRGPTFS